MNRRQFRIFLLLISTLLGPGIAIDQTGGATTFLLDDFESGLRIVQPQSSDYTKYIWGENGGTGTTSITTEQHHDGTHSLDIYFQGIDDWQFQFYTYTEFLPGWPDQWNFIRMMANNPSMNPSGGTPAWQLNKVNRLRFWIKVPPGLALSEPGHHNFEFGTFLKCATCGGGESDNLHLYHYFDFGYTGEWQQVIVDTHPDHERGGAGDQEWPDMLYPVTNPPSPGYTYYDLMTRFYLDFPYSVLPYPSHIYIDGFELYQETNPENVDQVRSLTAVYVPSTNEVRVGWTHRKDEPNVNHEVRYSFSDIFATGWANATPAPGGILTPPCCGGYNNFAYSSTAINVTGHTTLYIAIKPQNSSLFRQIAIPLSGGAPPPPAQPPSTPVVSISASPSSITSGESTTLSWSSSDVTSCTASGGWSGTRATSGNLSVSPTTTTTYTLTCTGTNGSANQSATVTVSAAAPTPPPSAPPPSSGSSAATYSLDEGSGSVAADSSGNGNTLSLSGPSWSSGKTGNALAFNGSGFADAASSGSLNITSNQLTLEAWANPTTLSGDTHIVSKIIQAGQHSNPYFAYSLHVVSGNVPRFWVTTGGVGHTVQSSVGLTSNTWYHIAGTYDGATLNIYVNGQLAGSASATGNINGYTGPLRLAANGAGGEVWNGKIDDVRVYSRALSKAEIQADMNTPVGGGVAKQPPAAPSALAVQ